MLGLDAAQKMDVSVKDWREAAKAAGLDDATIEQAIKETSSLFERIATGQAAPVTDDGKQKEGGE